MSVLSDTFRRLTQSLYPRGRAFRLPQTNAHADGIFQRLHTALAKSEARAYTAALSTLDSTIADNANFTSDDATDWENRLGIISGAGVTLSDRIKAINQKINYPGTNAPRQHYLYIQA